eukprot:TRINITY_DN136433_c0_g1_i1.p1 TRINITY_DN136433_c0_g1~~TRINITY_DN136433_c0_g1_i1.p1  ORF type:complete len:133 (-),score=38.52 TRINITY_DN136433_c0_g1_i1:121-519(-)
MSDNSNNKKEKGRGFQDRDGRYNGSNDQWDRIIDKNAKPGSPAKSIEGWIVIVRNIHIEAAEDDIIDIFSEYGNVENLQMPLDRRNGYVKGYALIEYGTQEEGEAAINELNESEFMEQTITVNWAFTTPKRG